ncbi:transmembrane repetitive protein [Stenotrophomonas sp. HITSZ_GD]|uniref:transmembrane repetitive protein n=1 Tax=Stenotrophomonas sp. HITSZ_GD TaxID=3037248 RepID=UPI00240E8128|nr:transmembrane repetitive protein [Stenotrophomonas sp. HITSZ_GD]MDG2524348.1 transmembrane repetitive protein [Stenotrophomonas sp. HITSZ_GD]
MTKAADLIDALLARKPVGPLLDRRTGLPFAWGHWARTRDVVASVAYPSREMTDIVAQRPPRASAGVLPPLSRWQAFRRLWWQQWEPRPRDERPYHWLAVLASFFIHLAFFALLLWVAVVRWAQPSEEGGEAGRVKLEMIGRGSPADTGGGPGEPDAGGAASPAPARQATAARRATRAQAAARASAAPAAAAPPPPAPAQARSDATETEPTSEPLTAPPMTLPTPRLPEPVIANQPLQVTETPITTTDFTLPPPQPVELAVPSPREVTPPPVQVRERQVVVAERPALVAPRVREVDAPSVRPAMPQVREREVVAVATPDITVPQPRPRDVPVPPVRAPDLQVRQIELPNPADAAPSPAPASEAAPAPAAASAPAATDTGRDAAASTTAATASSTVSGNAPASTPTPGQGATQAAAGNGRNASDRPAGHAAATGGSGPRAADRSGGWDTRAAGDDWSVGHQQRAGEDVAGAQGQGLYNRDGSLRVPAEGQGAGEAARGAPGGEGDGWTRERLADAGTWLKRPPYDYTPTSFDQYWVPSQSLLADWVRSGVKQIEIPIPGTHTKIKCVVSLLQFGGGCGLTNPNMQEQPAQARPPPDIPFKKDLQENNGSVR